MEKLREILVEIRIGTMKMKTIAISQSGSELRKIEEDSDSQNENQNEEEIEEKQLYSEDGVPQISIEDLLRCEDVLICHHEREFATMKGQ